jgi:hypothetical protein
MSGKIGWDGCIVPIITGLSNPASIRYADAGTRVSTIADSLVFSKDY